MNIKNLLIVATISLLLAACNTAKEIPYLTNIDQMSSQIYDLSTKATDFTVKAGDLLQIQVSASNKDAVLPFNKINYLAYGENIRIQQDYNSTYYIVDDHGDIMFPVIGKLHIAGKNKAAIEQMIATQIYPRYLTEMPSVEARIQNFRVFCIGEFNHPGVIQATNGRINLMEAIAQSGDLTIQGRRDNILLLRTDESGHRVVKRFNLGDANTLLQPEFNLQQNDILYVEPNASKARSAWQVPPMVSFGFTALSVAMSLITFITVLAK